MLLNAGVAVIYLIYTCWALPVHTAEPATQDEAPSLQLVTGDLGEERSIKWHHHVNLTESHVELSKYQPLEDASNVMFIKEKDSLEVDPIGVDNDRLSLVVYDHLIVLHMSVVQEEDGGIYRLEVPDSEGSSGRKILLAAFQTTEKQQQLPSPSSSSASIPDTEESTSSKLSTGLIIGIVILSGIAVLLLILSVLLCFKPDILRHAPCGKREEKFKPVTSGDGLDELDALGAKTSLQPENTARAPATVYVFGDQKRSTPVTISPERAERVRAELRENQKPGLCSWAKLCQQSSTESRDDQFGLTDLTLQNFSAKCGISGHGDEEDEAFTILSKCVRTPEYQGKVMELPFRSNHRDMCKQRFLLVRSRETEAGSVTMEMSYLEMEITAAADGAETEMMGEGDGLMGDPEKQLSQPSSLPLASVGDEDKQNYFRLEATKRLL